MLRTKVKASAITNLTDARYFAAWEVEWLGFTFAAESESFIDPRQVHAIKEWVDGPLIVGEFNLATATEITELVNDLQLDAIQAGVFTELTTLIELNNLVPVIKEWIIEPNSSPEDLLAAFSDFAPYTQYILLNFAKNGITWPDILAGKCLSPAWLQEVCANYPVLLQMDGSAQVVETLLRDLQPAGISVQGGEEEKVGFKSFDELDALFETLETFD